VRKWCIALLVVLTGCAPVSRHASPNSASGQQRIVTLVPSFADDLYALGAASEIVGVSAFTDAPGAQRLPRIADASSVDVEAILALRPSVVVGIPAQARLIEPLRHVRVAVVLLADDTYDEIFTNLHRLGAMSGRNREATAMIARLRRETAQLQRRTRSFARRPSVFVVLGSAPIWTAGSGSYISTLIQLAGGTNAAADLALPYGEYSAEALLRHQPDLIVADPATQLRAVANREPWRSLHAVRQGHVAFLNPEILERPGPKYNDGIRWLLAHLTPLAQRPDR
jgi:iron complex transport system substrate-binding protein